MTDNNYNFLKKFTLFSKLGSKDLSELGQLLKSRSFDDKTILFQQGDVGHNVYFIREGKVKAVKTTAEGEEQILEILSSGDVFGEVVLFGIEKYPATAVAMGNVKVELLSREEFKKYFNKNPHIGWGMLEVMANKLSRAQRKIKNLGLNDTRGRLANLLVDLLYNFGDADSKLVLDLNRQEMANYIGTTRETVSRALSQFKKDGLIDIQGNKIFIIDLDSLKQWD
ncbi:MAG: Crp/Fnr family transcriptional regulator [Halanaerobiales bacterium]